VGAKDWLNDGEEEVGFVVGVRVVGLALGARDMVKDGVEEVGVLVGLVEVGLV